MPVSAARPEGSMGSDSHRPHEVVAALQDSSTDDQPLPRGFGSLRIGGPLLGPLLSGLSTVISRLPCDFRRDRVSSCPSPRFIQTLSGIRTGSRIDSGFASGLASERIRKRFGDGLRSLGGSTFESRVSAIALALGVPRSSQPRRPRVRPAKRSRSSGRLAADLPIDPSGLRPRPSSPSSGPFGP